MRTIKLLTLILMNLFALTMNAEQWIDLTENYIKNAGFDNNSADYWDGTAFGFVNPMSNAEHYQRDFDTYQQLTGLTPGKYRIRMQGFYRAGSSADDWNHYNRGEEEYHNAQLYATSSEGDYWSPICYASSAALDAPLTGTTATVGSGGVTKYLPNTMEASHYWFEAGYYENEVECEVGEDGLLTIGIRKSKTISADWTCIDNWRIEYWGEVKKITTVYFLPSTQTMVVGDKIRLEPKILPADATIKKLVWDTSDQTVATVDQTGMVTCLRAGTVTIMAKTTDGTEKTARCRITVEGGATPAEAIVINEIMPANIDLFVDPSWNYGGYIEIYNPTLIKASIAGCYLSDDPDNLLKWRMPISMGSISPKGFYTIWFDHNDQHCTTQCPFKLDVKGGTIYFSDSEGKLLTSQDYPAAIRRCSYARTADGGSEWSWTGTPSPDATNAGSQFAVTQLDAPVANKAGQVFSGMLQVMVNIPQGATLRYTKDGSTPTLTNGFTSYTGSFSIKTSTSYRFRLFQEGYLPSDVVTHSYILNEKDFNIPILSIVTDNANIFGADYGLFVQGNGNGARGRGQSVKCNWNMEWDRPVSMEYFENGKEVSFAQEVNMSPCGGWSRAWTPHSFKLKANKVYGLNYLAYPFFPNKPYNKNKTLQVRNGGNDTSCRIIDPALQEIISRSGIDVDGQQYQPAFVYINGTLYDVLNIREPNNKHFAYANRGLDDDEMDQFEYSPDSAYVQMTGTRDAFERLYELSQNAADEDTYEEIKQLLDVDEFINYMAVEMYMGCGDWLNNSNNVKGYRPRTEDGKFRFVLFDLDSYGGTDNFNSVENNTWHSLDKLYDCPETYLYREIELAVIWLGLLENDEFRKQFIDAFCLVTGSVFEPNRCKAIVNELAERAYTAMHQQGGSPWGSANGIINTMSASRQNTMINKMKSYGRMQLSGINSITGSLSANIEEARLTVNGLPVPTDKFSGQLFPPVTVKAQAPAGYRFVGWTGSGTTADTELFGTTAKWYYYDKGSLDGKQWMAPDYSTSGWSQGNGSFGFATGSTWTDYNTLINYGTDKNNKRPTYYFRKTVTLDKAPSRDDTFTLNVSVDDGCVVYVNGTEAGRFNMPGGTVKYNTYASTYGDQFSYPQVIELAASLFTKGDNVIAVEVHNNDNVSSDIHWEASLMYGSIVNGDIVSADEEYTLPSKGKFNLVAVYEELGESELAEAQTPVRINEVSAGNSIYINEYFEREDWIELYNTTSETIDLAGMYLSDNINKPTKYQFESGVVSTVIEPHGYRVVWCDKTEPMNQLHASFKLANEDSYVVLTAADKTWADTLQYCAHDGLVTVGRYPDGGNDLFVMKTPTIGRSNTISTYDTLHIEIPVTADGISAPSLIARDGDMSIAYTGRYILVKGKENTAVELTVTTIAGQQVTSTELNLQDGHASYQLNLPQGLYVAYVMDNEGKRCATKLVVK